MPDESVAVIDGDEVGVDRGREGGSSRRRFEDHLFGHVDGADVAVLHPAQEDAGLNPSIGIRQHSGGRPSLS
jgi:hypothetical protein